MSTRPIRIAVDIGGTFTDLQVLDARSGAVRAWKTPTTPEDPSIGLMRGVEEAASRFGFALAEVGLLLHGTTIATNAVLERKLARGVLLTTAGFEDVLEINRHVRRELYKVDPDPFPCLIERDRRLGVPERLRADGSVEAKLDEAALPALLARLDALGAEAVAVCLLHSYRNPAHEQLLKALLAEARPGLPVSLSSEVSPEIREYERASTTVLNALLVPVVKAYLDRLERRLGESGFSPLVFLVQSNGGVCSLRTVAEQPARLLLSGPSGGALAAGRIATLLARPNLVAVDMGGTSYDVSIVQDGRVSVVTQGEIDRLPVRLPMVEMRTIGAGGGSIASVDHGGRLSVGPRSAGARPGPVSYGRGGTEPTVTDANLALGRLDPDYFLGGAMTLDMPATRAAIAAKVGQPLGLSLEAAAEGILTVTNANLGAAVRLSLFEKGLDPRDFALLSFGGAGGLHATDVAAEMGINEVIFPAEPGTLSAYGILYSDLVQDIARSRVLPAVAESLPEIGTLIGALREAAEARLAADGVAASARLLEVAVDMRYHGQAFELLVPWGEVAAPDAAALAALLARFHAMHRQRFSYADEAEAVELVTFRVIATGRLPKPDAAVAPPAPRPALKGRRRVHEGGEWRDLPVWDREALTAEDRITGPAILEEAFATHWIGRGWSAALGAAGALIARRDA
ncbi:hydantoinase/oxoprolinase family protein [Siccirubricoccus sp. KC 17139]|uniref:Hydantoinase/oxoprolinase family protein n=1 Tax=Siccirubricoccus soli TaxID=2899147 RepID=A0ABT1D611_9PROT|nr:hydantoinase/oxoprolinase family protein [Siccirubricoccus soli]MCO6417363.1 hydantoinase/oxoprolinase family protein [Siccirubricoccus soli]MCP2683498.1 hydantoinase/oxoprolinase family protein [Siccirubricoccus soli]